jgi:hypothetical protein
MTSRSGATPASLAISHAGEASFPHALGFLVRLRAQHYAQKRTAIAVHHALDVGALQRLRSAACDRASPSSAFLGLGSGPILLAST